LIPVLSKYQSEPILFGALYDQLIKSHNNALNNFGDNLNSTNGLSICKEIGSDLFKDLTKLNLETIIQTSKFKKEYTDKSFVLTEIYENSFRYQNDEELKSSKRDREGIFYTPKEIISKILDLSIDNALVEGLHLNLDGLSILDPACGGGVFLIEGFRRIKDKFPKLKASEILSTLYGVDKDPLAVFIARLSLIITASNENPEDINKFIKITKSNIRNGNSLISNEDKLDQDITNSNIASLLPFSWEREFPTIFNNGGFSIIIGNPPYGISRDQKISELENKIIKSKFKKYISGKPNKYMLFMAKSAEMLAADGIVSMVVPNSWLGIKSAKALREYFLKDLNLTDLITYDSRVFKDPSFEAVIFAAKKQKIKTNLKIQNFKSAKENLALRTVSVPLPTLLKRPAMTIPINWSEETDHVMNNIFSNSFLLGDLSSPFIPRIALQAYATGKGTPPQSKSDLKNRIFDFTQKVDINTFPYLDGADITRFKINWSMQFLKHGKWLADPQPIERFKGPRVLIREILGRAPYTLISAFTDETYLYNKSVLHILPKTHEVSKELLIALSAILNSKLGTFIIRNVGRKSQRKLFPKLVNDDLRSFPLPNNLSKFAPLLCELALKLSSQSDTNSIFMTDLDYEVFAAYGLNQSDSELIQKSLA